MLRDMLGEMGGVPDYILDSSEHLGKANKEIDMLRTNKQEYVSLTRFPYVPGTELRTLHVLTLPILPSNCEQGTITVSIFQMEN